MKQRIQSIRVETTGEREAPPTVAESERTSGWLNRIVKGTIFAVLFLTPLLYLPFTEDFLFAKVIAVEVAAVIAGTLWLLNVLVLRRASWARTPWNGSFLALALVLGAATVFSASPWSSFWGGDPTGEKTASILAFLTLSFVVAAGFRRSDVARASGLFLASFIVLGSFTLVSIFSGRWGLAPLPEWLNVNPAGTLNALAYVLAAGFVFGVSMVLSGIMRGGAGKYMPRWVWGLALAATLVLAPALVLIGFRMMWIAIGATMLLLLTLNFSVFRDPEGDQRPGLGSAGIVVAFLVLVASLAFAFSPSLVAGRIFQPPVELSPSLKATLAIGAKVVKSDPALGFGPAQFRLAYNHFRSVSLNETIFWTVRFSHGFSFMATLLSTVGVLGAAAFLGLVVSVLCAVGRAFVGGAGRNPFLWGLGGALFFILLMWFMYASNFTASFLMFAFLGLLGALLRESQVGGRDKGSWWEVRSRSVSADTPALNFAFSFAAVFAAALSVFILYALGAAYAGEIYFRRAARVLNLYGNVDSAKVFLARATRLNPRDDRYYHAQARVALAGLNRIILQAAGRPAQDLSGEFRTEFSGGLGALERATALAPTTAEHWLVLGQLYEVVMPFVAAADRAALDAYEQSARHDPPNPELPFARARLHLAQADLLTIQINQTPSGEERRQLEQTRRDSLAKAREALAKSLELKRDYAQAHFLLAQLAIREDNLAEAIRKTEETARLAPGDIGVVFQLGLLSYRAGSLDRAKAAFEQAVLLNDNYSNARYFLGLIWDRKGDTDGALSQFQKIAALNPENEEVKQIIANLRAGRSALAGIVPPAEAPEKRREAPLQ